MVKEKRGTQKEGAHKYKGMSSNNINFSSNNIFSLDNLKSSFSSLNFNSHILKSYSYKLRMRNKYNTILIERRLR